MIQTGTLVRQSSAQQSEAAPSPTSILFSPDKPSRLSSVFDVDRSGFIIHAVGVQEHITFVVDLLVAGVYSPLSIRGVRQQLTHDNNALEITTVGRYRLRVEGATNSASAVVEGSSMSRWT